MTTAAIDSTEHAVQVPGGELFVKRWASACTLMRPPVVLLHDSIGCVEMWRQFPVALAIRLGRPVIAYDRLGYGRSSPQHSLPSIRFVSAEAETNFPAIRAHFGFERFILFGHSVGGGMAVTIAAESQGVCQAIITESAQAYVEQRTLSAIAEAKEKFKAPQELAKLERYHGARARWVVDAWTDSWLSPAFRDWHVREELARVTSPLLAIHGEHDEYGSTAFPVTLTATAGPAEKAVLLNCGHVPHREQESLVLETVDRFLDRHGLSPEPVRGDRVPS